MKSYSLYKWFFDILLLDGSYICCYITEITFYKFKVCRLNIHYIKNGEKISLSEKVKLLTGNTFQFQLEDGCFERYENRFHLHIHSSRLLIDLIYTTPEYYNVNGIDPQLVNCSYGNIKWVPLALEATVEGKVQLEEKIIEIKNQKGYIDYVFSSVLPHRNPLENLFWGRIHTQNLSLSYSIAFNKIEQNYSNRIIVIHDGKVQQADFVDLKTLTEGYSERRAMSYPRKLLLAVRINDTLIELIINQEEILIESGFIDEQKGMNRFLLNLVQKFAGNLRGIKFLSTVIFRSQKSISPENSEIKLISEFVRF